MPPSLRLIRIVMMTANSAGNPSNPLAPILAALKSAGRLIARVALGGLALVAAGIVAMAAALLGLLIALAALIFRFSPKRTVSGRQYRARPSSTEDGIVLEAHKSGQGWTVE